MVKCVGLTSHTWVRKQYHGGRLLVLEVWEE